MRTPLSPDAQAAAKGKRAWGVVFPQTTGTESSSVESAVARITHSIWSIQRLASD